MWFCGVEHSLLGVELLIGTFKLDWFLLYAGTHFIFLAFF